MPPPHRLSCVPLVIVLMVGCGDGAPLPTGGDAGSDATLPDPDAAIAADGGSTPGDDAGIDTADAAEPDAGPPGFTRVAPHEPDGPLCDIPDGYVEAGGDPVHVPCALAAGHYAPTPAAPPARLRVVTWNVAYGSEHATVLETLRSHPELSGADILLLSEVARRDLSSRPAGVDQAHDIAVELSLDYVFAVEWDRRLNEDEGGEHGVVILSRFPIGNATVIRHVPQNDWYAEDRRYGGRATLGADLLVGDRLVRVYTAHLDTRGGDGGRAMQGAEIRGDADLPVRSPAAILGGDLNTWTCNPLIADCTRPPAAETVIEDLLADGWLDGTEGFNGHTQLGRGFFPQRLDWIFARGLCIRPGTVVDDARGSDHLPLYSDVLLD